MTRFDKLLGTSALLFNLIYIIWLGFNFQGIPGLYLLTIDTGFVFLILLYLFNHRQISSETESRETNYESLDVFLPVVNEPLEIFEKTVKAAANIIYENKQVYILDDGNRQEIKQLANAYNIKL